MLSKDEPVDPDLYTSNRHKKRSRKAKQEEPAAPPPEPETFGNIKSERVIIPPDPSSSESSSIFGENVKATMDEIMRRAMFNSFSIPPGFLNDAPGYRTPFVDYADIIRPSRTVTGSFHTETRDPRWEPPNACKECGQQRTHVVPPLGQSGMREAYLKGFCSPHCQLIHGLKTFDAERRAHEERQRDYREQARRQSEQSFKQRWSPCPHKHEFLRRRLGSAMVIKTSSQDWEKFVSLEPFLEWLRAFYKSIEHRYHNPPTLTPQTEERLRHIHEHQPAKVWRLAILDILAEIDAA